MIMTERKVAIVLGGTSPHIELIRQLHERNFFVVLVDYLSNPPAKQYADVHIQESTLDCEAVLNVAIEFNASLVISACVDQANITACYVAEKLNLPRPYSYELANNITNKGYMKEVMVANNIPTTRYVFLDKDENLTNFGLRFPVMVKPADSCAASGVKKANNFNELLVFLNDAKKISRTGRTVVEEFFSGVEVSVYAFIKDRIANILMISERISIIEGENQVLKCYATITPPNISEVALAKIQESTTCIANVFNLDNTPLHVQYIIDGDEISVIEFAPRVGGGISYKNIKSNTGFDIISSTIDSYLQKSVDVRYQCSNRYFSVNLVYGVPSTFHRMTGIEDLLNEGIVDSIHYHKTPGSVITDDRASGGRIAAILISGDTRQDVLDKVKITFERINAFDSNGNQILRKDLYIKQ
jgi:biotin carboxylase